MYNQQETIDAKFSIVMCLYNGVRDLQGWLNSSAAQNLAAQRIRIYNVISTPPGIHEKTRISNVEASCMQRRASQFTNAKTIVKSR